MLILVQTCSDVIFWDHGQGKKSMFCNFKCGLFLTSKEKINSSKLGQEIDNKYCIGHKEPRAASLP